MNDLRVILITVTSPEGASADVGARSDATPRDLAAHLGTDPALSVVQHHAPERPGGLPRRQRLIRADVSLAESGVLDGDTLVFARTGAAASGPAAVGPGGAVPAVAIPPQSPAG